MNGIAVQVPSSGIRDRKAALQEITHALARIDALQRLLVASDADLEYHLDPNRPPTRAMKEILGLVEAAENHVRQGNLSAAEEILRRAQEKEPPLLVYETIAKRIDSIRRSGRTD